MTEFGKPTGYDRVRGTEIGYRDFELDYVEEAYGIVFRVLGFRVLGFGVQGYKDFELDYVNEA